MGDYCYQQELRHELKQKSASLTLAESGSAECIPSGGSESEATHKNMYIFSIIALTIIINMDLD